MKLRNILIILVVLIVAAFGVRYGKAQSGGAVVQTSSGAPTGACVSPQADMDSTTGDLWACNGVTWRQITFPFYNTSGVLQLAHHYVMGKAILVAGTVTVTLSGKAVFASASSYVCTLADSTGLNATAVSYTSGSQFTINGVLTDQVSFVCIGN